jgi:hypothetical protein
MRHPALSAVPRASRVWLLTMASVALAAAGCHHAAPTAPGPPRVSIEGTWTGTLSDRAGLVSRITMIVAGIEHSASGTFTLSFDDPSMNASGLVLGSTVDAPAIHLTFVIQQAGARCAGTPGVFYQARVALVGNEIEGDYEPAFGCDLLTRGLIRLTRL